VVESVRARLCLRTVQSNRIDPRRGDSSDVIFYENWDRVSVFQYKCTVFAL
jgi:hypothetical protein